ncbi:unnamed protein product, partial [Protopolystoma xenopodis]
MPVTEVDRQKFRMDGSNGGPSFEVTLKGVILRYRLLRDTEPSKQVFLLFPFITLLHGNIMFELMRAGYTGRRYITEAAEFDQCPRRELVDFVNEHLPAKTPTRAILNSIEFVIPLVEGVI